MLLWDSIRLKVREWELKKDREKQKHYERKATRYKQKKKMFVKSVSDGKFPCDYLISKSLGAKPKQNVKIRVEFWRRILVKKDQ